MTTPATPVAAMSRQSEAAAEVTPLKGPEVPCVDDYFSPANQPGLTLKRRTWKNDTSKGPIGVSPIQQDKTYLISRKQFVFRNSKGEDVFEFTTPIPVQGSELVSPAGDADHGPPELQEVVAIKDGEKMLTLWEVAATP